MGTLKTQAPAYTDLAGLSRLKREAGVNDPAAIRVVAQQFESMFTRMMLKSMRDASGPDPMFGSDQQKMYQDMADDQLSIQLARGKGLGLADMLIRQFQKMGLKGADAAAAGAKRTDSAGSGGKATGITSTSTAGTGVTVSGSTAAEPVGTGVTGAKAAAAYSATARASAIQDAESAKTTFVQDLWPQAELAGQLLGVDPRHLIAQAALETNWGRNVPEDSAGRSSNNLFGMKVSADWCGATVTNDTREFRDGVAASTSATFKAYATPAESVQDYVALLRNSPRYSAALNTGGDVEAFATGLQRGGYATDPAYANKIASLARAVAHKVNDVLASRSSVIDLKLAGPVPIAANTEPYRGLTDE